MTDCRSDREAPYWSKIAIALGSRAPANRGDLSTVNPTYNARQFAEAQDFGLDLRHAGPRSLQRLSRRFEVSMDDDDMEPDRTLTSKGLAELIVVLRARILREEDVTQAIAIAAEEIEARKAGGDY